MSVYLQLVDVLLGCVQFDWKDQWGYYTATSKSAQDKREMVEFVKSQLGMKPETRFLERGQSFSQWDHPSLFTVWQREA